MQAYRADIDGLRAIAVLLVVVFHFDIFSAGKAGFIGVDVFFVISGYLITSILVRDIRTGTFRYSDFLYRRVRRLYPAMLTTLVLYAVFGGFFMLPAEYEELMKETFLSLAYVVNIYFWQSINYFGIQAQSVPLLHMWSLAVEEQFYLIYPLFIVLVARFAGGRVLLWLAIVTLASFVLGYLASSWKPEAAFYLLPTRAWELLAGGVLAMVVRRGAATPAAENAMGMAGLGLIMVALVIYTPAILLPGWYALLPTLGAMLVIASGESRRSWFSQAMGAPALAWIGRISYPLYLVHWPVLIAMKAQLQVYSIEWRVLSLILSVGLAWVIYRMVEMPVRKMKILTSPRRFLAVAGAASLATMGAALFVMKGDGLPKRFPEEAMLAVNYASDLPTEFSGCQGTRPKLTSMCPIGEADAEPRVVVIGDSHARALAPAFSTWLARNGRAGLVTFQAACPPVEHVVSVECEAFTKSMFELVHTSPEIEEVILVSIWRYGITEGGLLHNGAWADAAEAPSVIGAELRSTVEALTAAGKKVVLVEPFYAAPRNVPQTLASNIAFGRDWSVDTLLEAHRNQFRLLYDAFSQAQGPDVRRISLIDHFCADGICRGQWLGRPVFTDNNHPALGMSDVIADVLEEKLPFEPRR